jgi:hypothetical protein
LPEQEPPPPPLGLQKNFTLVVLAIVAVSIIPIALEVLNARKEEQQGKQPGQGGGKTGGEEQPGSGGATA